MMSFSEWAKLGGTWNSGRQTNLTKMRVDSSIAREHVRNALGLTRKAR